MFSQNLVINPSFESTSVGFKYFIDDKDSQICVDVNSGYLNLLFHSMINPKYWLPNTGSPDFFSTNEKIFTLFNLSKKKDSISNISLLEHFEAKTGTNFIGLYPGYESITGRLNKRLQKGETYKVSFWVRINRSQKYYSKYINVTFLNNYNFISRYDNTLSRTGRGTPYTNYINSSNYNKNTVKIKIGRSNSRRDRWVKVSAKFAAQGGESVISIGFQKSQSKVKLYTQLVLRKKNVQSTLEPFSNQTHFPYYFIDDICVTLESNPDCTEVMLEREKKIGSEKDSINQKEVKKFVLENLEFEVNSAKLKPSIVEKLEELTEQLKGFANDSFVISIFGHTDSTGNEPINRLLSQNRADTVKRFLINRGIPEKILSSKGMGSTQPIASNQTTEGRQKNRRVEIVIYRREE